MEGSESFLKVVGVLAGVLGALLIGTFVWEASQAFGVAPNSCLDRIQFGEVEGVCFGYCRDGGAAGLTVVPDRLCSAVQPDTITGHQWEWPEQFITLEEDPSPFISLDISTCVWAKEGTTCLMGKAGQPE